MRARARARVCVCVCVCVKAFYHLSCLLWTCTTGDSLSLSLCACFLCSSAFLTLCVIFDATGMRQYSPSLPNHLLVYKGTPQEWKKEGRKGGGGGGGVGGERERGRGRNCCLTSQQQASVSQGRICSENCTYCHTETEAADQTFYLTHWVSHSILTPVRLVPALTL